MIILLLRFLRGFITVKFSGVSSEQILSRINRERISVWDLRYRAGTITCKMPAKDFKRIRKLRKNTGVGVHILKKFGLPFFIRKYHRRAGLAIGALIFIFMMNYLGGFIWIINVNGNLKVSQREILLTLKEIGITEITKKKDIDSKNDAQTLILARNDLSWASLNIEGCVLNVNVREIQAPESMDELPSNLVAGCDGIIKKIDAASGNVTVKVGESVHKGDILVSGIIEDSFSTTFVKSSAVITAQIEKEYRESECFEVDNKVLNGKKTIDRVVEVLGIKIPLFIGKNRPPQLYSYKKEYATLFGKKIPVVVYTKTGDYYDTEVKTYSRDELIEKLSAQLNEYITGEDISGYIPLSTEFVTDSSRVTVIHKFFCDENIAKEAKIITSQKIDNE
ncbi:MAG: sporulation protein YqfD [Clostridia bacterium]|nr:sporulation protein YqfD [Clostridia bacterium]